MKTTFFDSYHAGWQHSHSADLATEPRRSFRQALSDVVQGALRFMTNANDEPHIWMSRDNHGVTHWNAYDPLTNRRLSAATENEVLVWLEERYNYH